MRAPRLDPPRFAGAPVALVIAVAAAGCASKQLDDSFTTIPESPPNGSTRPADTGARAPTAAVDPRGELPDGYPYVRLKRTKNPLEPLAFELPKESLDAWGVRDAHYASATAPRVWLIVLEFATRAALVDAIPKIEAHFATSPPPHYVKTSYTGVHLLVTGFPSEKPVSPEMEFGRVDFISAFAGEE